MKRSVRLWLVLILVVVAFVTGFAVAGAMAWSHTRSLALENELETTGLCANGLRLASDGSHDRVDELLRARLDDAIRHSSGLVGDGARLRGAHPNLIESVRRAASFYDLAGDAEMRETTEVLLAAVSPER